MSNAVMVAAGEGVETHLLSMVGDDADGRFLASSLRNRGVSTRRLIRSRLHPTTTAVVLSQIATGERRFIVPDRRAMEKGAPDFDLSLLRPGVVLMIDGHFPGQISRAVHRAKELGVPVVGDFSDARPAFQQWLPHVDYPILPTEFVKGYGAGDVRQTLRLLHRTLRRNAGGDPGRERCARSCSRKVLEGSAPPSSGGGHHGCGGCFSWRLCCGFGWGGCSARGLGSSFSTSGGGLPASRRLPPSLSHLGLISLCDRSPFSL